MSSDSSTKLQKNLSLCRNLKTPYIFRKELPATATLSQNASSSKRYSGGLDMSRDSPTRFSKHYLRPKTVKY
jgi:hypothetical protein